MTPQAREYKHCKLLANGTSQSHAYAHYTQMFYDGTGCVPWRILHTLGTRQSYSAHYRLHNHIQCENLSDNEFSMKINFRVNSKIWKLFPITFLFKIFFPVRWTHAQTETTHTRFGAAEKSVAGLWGEYNWMTGFGWIRLVCDATVFKLRQIHREYTFLHNFPLVVFNLISLW